MALRKFPLNPSTIIPFVVLVVILAVTMPRRGEFDYTYSKGSKWKYETLVAPFDFPILKTEKQINDERQRLGNAYVPYFTFSDAVSKSVISSVKGTLTGYELVGFEITSWLSGVYDRGVLPGEDVASYGRGTDSSIEVAFIQKDKRAGKIPYEELYKVDDVCVKLTEMLRDKCGVNAADSILNKTQLLSKIRPNLIFDSQITDAVRQESADYISPTSGVFRGGDVIISAGEIITADIEQILDSYKAEFQTNVGYNGPTYMLWLGNLLMAFILALMVACIVWFIRPSILSSFNNYVFILSIFLLSSCVTFVFSRFDATMLYLMPYPVFAMYYLAFYRKRFVISIYSVCLLPMLLFCQNGEQMFFIFLSAGFAAVSAFSHFNRGWRQFISAFIIFAVMLFVYLSFKLMGGSVAIFNPKEILFMFLGSFFCILAYPLIYLFEIIFNLVSVGRLVDLTDTNNSLLREFSDKAPGSFQHSLSVMNMAEAAARAIDADVQLVRAGAMYHDIGKIFNPQCFIENQAPGVNYHDGLSASESAALLIRHVADGISIAEKHNVPSVVRDFIAVHHGTTTTGYFYNKFLNEGGDASRKSEFQYPGPRPKTKEHVILMLCDTLEAASRTLNEFSMEAVSSFVDKILESKFNDGQFNEADIDLKEIDTIKQLLKSYIVQIHHGRIAYPENKRNK